MVQSLKELFRVLNYVHDYYLYSVGKKIKLNKLWRASIKNPWSSGNGYRMEDW